MLTDQSTWQRIAALLPSPITVVDIGARGGIEDHWSQFGPHIRAYGFEPDGTECDRLNRSGDQTVEYIPLAAGSTTGERRFYVTHDPLCSSLFPPIEQLARERPRLAEMRVHKIVTVQTRTIDDWAREYHISHLDHLKLDAQGAELAILEGSASSLGTIRSIKLEVQFNRLYDGAPLFGQIDLFLRERGFVLWRLSELSHCGFAGVSGTPEVPEILDYDSRRVEMLAGGGQLLWANAYYVRRETAQLSEHVDWEDSVRDACLAQAHHYTDLAEVSLRRSLLDVPSETRAVIHTAVSGAPAQ
jgi:FkbM family methyltransferase